MENLEELTAGCSTAPRATPNEIGAASVEYLHVFGYTAYAYMWALMARTALAKQGEDDFYASKRVPRASLRPPAAAHPFP